MTESDLFLFLHKNLNYPLKNLAISCINQLYMKYKVKASHISARWTFNTLKSCSKECNGMHYVLDV